MCFESVKNELTSDRKIWLVTGVAGFIGSNLLEELLNLNQVVIGLDNFSTGKRENLNLVKKVVTEESWSRFTFVEGDIKELETCKSVCEGVDYVLHQAALGSVPRSLNDPIATNANNIDGFLNMLVAARDANVHNFVYAASSSTYGDHPGLPKKEEIIGKPLSPYAVTKYVNELYADVFGKCYNFRTIGLRYFNIFGPRQDPNGAYAAVIPKWISAIINNSELTINGDGETSRDFCYVKNAVQANILAAVSTSHSEISDVFNVAVSDRTSLSVLYENLKLMISHRKPEASTHFPVYKEFRAGDVRHSQADISKIQKSLGYHPTHRIAEGLLETIDWHFSALGDK